MRLVVILVFVSQFCEVGELIVHQHFERSLQADRPG